MKIAITGGAGFIGGHVADRLEDRGHQVVIVDPRQRQGSLLREHRLADVRDATAMAEVAAHVDGMIHLAAVLGTQETIANPRPAAETNILGGLAVLEACQRHGIPLVYAGVGNHWMLNTYSTTKTCTERLLAQYVTELGLRAVTVRPMNAYGPRQAVAPPFGPAKVRKIVPAFVCRALSGMPIEVYGDGSQVSAMVHVTDVAEAFCRALEHLVDGYRLTTIEIGPDLDHATTVRQVAERVAAITSELSGREPVPVIELPMRPGEQPDRPVVADPSTLAQIGMFDPDLVDLDEGLTETIHWFSDMEGATWRRPS